MKVTKLRKRESPLLAALADQVATGRSGHAGIAKDAARVAPGTPQWAAVQSGGAFSADRFNHGDIIGQDRPKKKLPLGVRVGE